MQLGPRRRIFPDHPNEPFFPLETVPAHFLKPGRDHDGAADPLAAARLQQVGHRVGGNHQHHQVRRIGQVLHGPVGGDALHLLFRWVDGIKNPFETQGLEGQEEKNRPEKRFQAG